MNDKKDWYAILRAFRKKVSFVICVAEGDIENQRQTINCQL